MSLQLAFHPLILLFIVAALVALGLAWYAFQIKQSPAARTFAWYALAIFWWEFTSVLEMASVDINAKIFWTALKYVGATGGPVLALILALQTTRNDQWLKKRWFVVTIWGWAITTTLVVWSSSFHDWYWTGFYLEPGVLEVLTDKGWWFGIYAAGMYLIILVSTVLYFVYLRKAAPLYRKQAFWLAVGGFTPLFFRIVNDFAGIKFIEPVDQVPFFIFFSVIFYAVALFRYNALKLVPIAYDQVIENIDAGVLVVDNSNTILDINPLAIRLFKVDRDKAIGQSLGNLFADLTAGELNGIELWKSVQGTKRCFQVQVSSIRLTNEQTAGAIVMLYDITELKSAEAALAAANKQRQRMTADIAHDLRTPIQVIGGYLEAMADGVLNPTEKRFQTMSQEMEHLGSMVNDFLTISKADSGDLSLQLYPTSVNDLLERVQNFYEPVILQQQKHWKRTPLDTDIALNMDADRILQVFSNFLRNAMNHTEVGDTISVHAVWDERFVRFLVTDTGVGIQPEHLSLVFDRLFRADESREQDSGSHGLGLAICQSLVQAHDGDIGVDSDGLGHGATFWFTLPRQQDTVKKEFS